MSGLYYEGFSALAGHDDIGDLLRSWPFDPDDYVREVEGTDGKPKLQVRFPMGIEQYELDGRPDGLRPMGHESYLHHYLERRDALLRDLDSELAFALEPEDCEMLRDEAVLYYYRYDLLAQRKDHERVVRDTARNLVAFDLVAQYATVTDSAESMEPYRPYTLRLHYAARALLSMKQKLYDNALRHLHEGLEQLGGLEPLPDLPKHKREIKRAAGALKRLQRRIRRARPLSQREKLQQELRRAVDREDYEVAASLRDRLASLADD